MDVKFYGAVVVLVAMVGAAFAWGQAGTGSAGDAALETFSSQDEFRDYLRQGAATSDGYGTTTSFDTAARTEQALEADAGGTGGGETPRYSETNVQEEGIDEPDIVKTDGDTIYYARGGYGGENTTFIDARPPEQARITGSIGAGSQLLLQDDLLLTFSESGRQQAVAAYDVSDPSNPQRDWRLPMNGSVEAARMYNGKIYLVLRERIDTDNPCPIYAGVGPEERITVPCDRIYHPSEPIDADVTYTALVLDPAAGTVDDSAAFVGNTGGSTVYMSRQGIYVTYRKDTGMATIMTDFLAGPGSELLDQETVDRIRTVQGYELSAQARLTELQSILNEYRRSLDRDERRTFETRFEDRFANYTQDHAREFQRTGITRIDIGDGLDVAATGTVPGRMLNQFSMDVHDSHLRVATTVDPVRGIGQSMNDVYVLDQGMDVVGKVTDMGLNEQIYSVRFLGDKGYVVTFRRIDPFHVLDLSDPENPELKGELKLPGFSSYLHPMPGENILGIGEEDGQVKVVMFDVSDPTDPTVKSDYILDEYWSAISQSHHAFLHDEKNGVFFVPAGNGGYVFSYKRGIDLKKAVDMQDPQRAVYIGDYLYILGRSEMVVLDENTWDRVKTLDLGAQDFYREPIPLPRPR